MTPTHPRTSPATNSARLIKELADADGPPGFEHEIRAIMERHLSPLGEIRRDRIGGLIATIHPARRRRATTPRVAVTCHMDEVGFLVQSVRADGLLRLLPLGGWWPGTLPGQRLHILAPAGKIVGVVGANPPHHLPADQRDRIPPVEQLHVDIGAASREQAAGWGVEPGTPACPLAPLTHLHQPGSLVGKALDNRLGCALCIEAATHAKSASYELTICATAQEEVGCRGAAAAATLARPDIAIVLETAPADDTPGLAIDEPQTRVGRGVQIRLADPSAIAHPTLARLAVDSARQHGIPFQTCVRRSGGTDASKLQPHQIGVPTLVLAVPARYIHSHNGLCHLDDYLAARELLQILLPKLAKLDPETLAG